MRRGIASEKNGVASREGTKSKNINTVYEIAASRCFDHLENVGFRFVCECYSRLPQQRQRRVVRPQGEKGWTKLVGDF